MERSLDFEFTPSVRGGIRAGSPALQGETCWFRAGGSRRRRGMAMEGWGWRGTPGEGGDCGGFVAKRDRLNGEVIIEDSQDH